MTSHTLVCTGCGCLCDDIQVAVEDARLGKIDNLCAKGAAYLGSADNPERRARNLIAGREVSLEQAIEEAAQLLSEAKNCWCWWGEYPSRAARPRTRSSSAC